MRREDWDIFGEVLADTSGMSYPVRCAYCSGVYDVGTVEVTARYVDCSMWKAPCCGRTVDDRGETGWKSIQDYYRLKRSRSAWDPTGCVGGD